ncbi:ATP-binding protein [Nonomuraea sp. C10]|uniref:sensor histidine kinase n=1 Tax=Nonomuraea sp. C10 TaxID=2600577 RepID=UPI0011CE71B3|nr:ATP-binding protein [Nonomuraea sp. C10]TXK38393.1 HAMP domain-containing protein [Nonomuraea sp. C10]
MSINPLPPAKPPTGVGRVPIARWFVFAGAATAVAFLAGVALIMLMIAQARELAPKPEVAAQIDRLNVALVVLFVVILVAGVALAFIVRFTVLDPIARLTEQVRTVAGGDFDHRLGVERPAELAELSSHIDSMRRRILSAWRTASDQADELRRSNGELEQFAYVASHDLQEPLRKVASFTQMLEQRYENELDDRARQYIHYAVDGAKRMQLLINDLLDFSRVGRVGGEKAPMDSGVPVRAALDNLSAAIEDAGATVTTGELPRVTGSPSQLTQLFQNLIENAVKFRGDEPPHVRIEAVERDGMWEFSCSDNGIGVDPKYADRIFLIFQRLHPRDVYAGTGIGLALCRKIVDYHGGRLWLDGDSGETGGRGTTFRWTLPAAGDDDA